MLADVSAVQPFPFSIHLAADVSLSALANSTIGTPLHFSKHLLLSKCLQHEICVHAGVCCFFLYDC
jgi:hypothetical protein